MTRPTFVLVALYASSVTALAAAQSNWTDFPINVNNVDASTRISWCNAEHNNCQGLCGGPTMVTTNDCDYTSLAYKCTCSNGSAPGLQYYSDTMPSLICQEAQKECIKTNENNLSGQENCTKTIGSKCGLQDPTKVTGGSSSSSSSSSSTTPANTPGTGTSGGSAGSPAPATTSPPSKGGAVNVATLSSGAAAMVALFFAALL